MLLELALVVLSFMAIVMAIAWAFGLAVKNGGWTDVFWTLGTGGALAGAALWPDPAATPQRQWLVAGLAGLWAIRLGVYLTRRVAGHPEDARYADFRRQFGARYPLGMAGVALAQAPATAILSLSVILAAHRPVAGLGPRDLLGAAFLIAALAGEGLADDQMRRFKANAANKGRVCDVGLWAWSRHPNYFFEWLGWLAYPAIALDPAVPTSWLSLTAPLVMLVLLTRVSGVPPLEQAMLRSRGEAYRAYQARVSAFFPLPPRSPA